MFTHAGESPPKKTNTTAAAAQGEVVIWHHYWTKLKSGCHRKVFAIFLSDSPSLLPPFPAACSSLSVFTRFLDLILCCASELNQLILHLEQCQSWQQGKQQGYMVMKSGRKSGWRSWISLFWQCSNMNAKMQSNREPEHRAGHESYRYHEGSKSRSVCVCTGCYSLRYSLWVAVFPSWLYPGSSQHGSKELTIAYSHVLGSFDMSPQVPTALQWRCTDYSSNHRRKGWCVAVGSISDLSKSQLNKPSPLHGKPCSLAKPMGKPGSPGPWEYQSGEQTLAEPAALVSSTDPGWWLLLLSPGLSTWPALSGISH